MSVTTRAERLGAGRLVRGGLVILALGVGLTPRVGWAQADPSNFMFLSGQTVGPVFEGWSRNTDGSFEMHFGYINRNYNEELHLAIGAQNRFEPGDDDRGQPTFFYPRIHRRVFQVTVPADWGDQELVWTLVSRGEEHRAVGWLQPEWEIAAPGMSVFGGTPTEENEAPSLEVYGARAVATADTLALTVVVTDDGLPAIPERSGGGQAQPPTLEPDPAGPTLPVNVPALLPDNRSRPTRLRFENVVLTWMLHRGQPGVTVDTDEEPTDGQLGVRLTFPEPGQYVFHVAASDRQDTTDDTVTITVSP